MAFKYTLRKSGSYMVTMRFTQHIDREDVERIRKMLRAEGASDSDASVRAEIEQAMESGGLLGFLWDRIDERTEEAMEAKGEDV